MKGRFFILAVLLLLTAPVAARRLQWGMETGWDVRNLKMSSETFRARGKSGWFIGPKASLPIPFLRLRIESAVLYKQRMMDFTNEDTQQTDGQTLGYLVFPVSLRYTYSVNKVVGIYLSAGPQWSRYICKSNYLRCFDQVRMRIDRSTLSANVGLGVELASHLQIGFTYNFGIDEEYWSNGFGKAVSDFDMKKNSYQFRISCLF